MRDREASATHGDSARPGEIEGDEQDLRLRIHRCRNDAQVILNRGALGMVPKQQAIDRANELVREAIKLEAELLLVKSRRITCARRDAERNQERKE